MTDGNARLGRRRGVAMIGAGVLVVAGVVGVVVIAGGSDEPDADSGATVTATTTLVDIESDGGGDSADTEPGAHPDSDAGPDADSEPAADADPTVDDATETAASPGVEQGVDAATPYLVDTVLLAERSHAVGEIEVRLSTASYADVFDLEWDLPTGSRDECLGRPALFVRGQPTGSADTVVLGPVGLQTSWSAVQLPPEVARSAGPRIVTSFTPLIPAEVIVVIGDGSGTAWLTLGSEFVDEAPVADGYGVLVLEHDPYMYDEQPAEPIVVTEIDGVRREQPLYASYAVFDPADPCQPPQPPQPRLPEPGQSPADAEAAESAIRAVHAELVDQSLTDPARLDSLVDDPTGIAEAADEMRSGSFADSAAEAEYEIETVVFTTPTEAYFDYSITAPTGTFGNRFGRAVVVDGEWRITRATICQDLALAAGICRGPAGPPDPVLPGGLGPDEFDEWYRENDDLIQRYYQALSCHQLSGCWIPSLPDPGEQPADPAAAAADIDGAITALVDTSTPLEAELLDDATGVREAAEAFVAGGLASAVEATDVEVVFTSPDEAWFEFQLVVAVGDDGLPSNFGHRFGRAVSVDGSWLITRGTMCDLLALGGQLCEPDWTAEVPPG